MPRNSRGLPRKQPYTRSTRTSTRTVAQTRTHTPESQPTSEAVTNSMQGAQQEPSSTAYTSRSGPAPLQPNITGTTNPGAMVTTTLPVDQLLAMIRSEVQAVSSSRSSPSTSSTAPPVAPQQTYNSLPGMHSFIYFNCR